MPLVIRMTGILCSVMLGNCSGAWRVGLIKLTQTLCPGGPVSFMLREYFIAMNGTHNGSLKTNFVKLATKESG